MAFVYVNGTFCPQEDARVPADDRGFRFGDGVFETLSIHHGKPYQLAFHLQRLRGGLAALGIPEPECDWEALIGEAITRNTITTGMIRIAISRGSGSHGYRPAVTTPPCVVITATPAKELPVSDPVRLFIAQTRRIPLACLPVNYKLAQGVNNVLALAEDASYDNALMLTVDGMLCECASANLFWIRGDEIFTPPLSTGCLDGATRHAVIRLHPVREVVAEPQTLSDADAVFITNSRSGIAPVVEIKDLGHWPQTHPLITELQKRYRADIDHGA
jgi:branched-subunit amino acid aminotransferase/4-amino-4-deoxychorismate lyase